jgi:hypothetical protein
LIIINEVNKALTHFENTYVLKSTFNEAANRVFSDFATKQYVDSVIGGIENGSY